MTMNNDKEKISFGITNTSNVAVPLLPFDTIVDTDVGLLNLIDRGYASPDYFDIDFFKTRGNNQAMVKTLYERREVNPLSLCIKDKSLADKLYTQFFNDKYPEILMNSVFTGLFYMLNLFSTSGDIIPSILYKNDIEKEFLDIIPELKKVQKFSVTELLEDEKLAVTFKQFYFKSPNNEYLEILKSLLYRKTIYFLDYGFNITDDNDLIYNDTMVLLELYQNNICIINAYDKARLEMKEDN